MAKIFDNKQITNRINTLMQANQVTSYKLAGILDISQATLSRNLNGLRDWSGDTMIKIAEHFKVPIEWLLHGKEAEETGLKLIYEGDYEVPIYSSAICGQPVGDWSEPKKFMVVDFMKGLVNPFGIVASGMSMSPTIMPGDIVFGYKPDKQPKDGSLVIASIKSIPDTKEGAIKRIKELDKQHIILYSDQAGYEPWVVKKNEIYEIFAMHDKIIRSVR